MSDGKLFQSRDAAAANVLSPKEPAPIVHPQIRRIGLKYDQCESVIRMKVKSE